MDHLNSDNWKITDDDKILKMTSSEILAQENKDFKQTTIHPREDLIQIIHKESNIILDLGYYGENVWQVYAIDKLAEWKNPIEEKTFDSLVKSIAFFKKLAVKYS